MAPGWLLLSYIWALIINRVPVSKVNCHHLRFLSIFFILPPEYMYHLFCD